MDIVSLNKFKDNLKTLVEQETLHVLQNRDLMRQIAASVETHSRGQEEIANEQPLNEIAGN